MHRLQHFVQRDMGRLKYSLDPNGELLPALFGVTLPQTEADLTVLALHAFKAAGATNGAAMGANHAVFPEELLQVTEGFAFVVEVGFIEDGSLRNPCAAGVK